jgi:CRP/FNR family transcriptional regulator, cyclic AMP receptor protein
MDQVQLRQTLRELHFSAPLSDSTAEKLAAMLSPCDFPAGATLFEEGTFNPRLYLIVGGEIGLEMCVPARGCTRILTLGPGDLLAWSSLLGEGRMTATAIALRPAKLLTASAPDIGALCQADREFGYELMRGVAQALSKRLVATRLQLLDLYGAP